MARKIAATLIAGLLGGWLALWVQQMLIDNRVIRNEPCRDVVGTALSCAAPMPSGWIVLLAAVAFGTATYLLLRSRDRNP